MAMSISSVILSRCFVLKQSNHEVLWFRLELCLLKRADHFVINEVIVEIVIALVEGVEDIHEQVSIVVKLNRYIWKESARSRH